MNQSSCSTAEDQPTDHIAPKTLLLAIAAPFVAVGVLAAPLVLDLARHAGGF